MNFNYLDVTLFGLVGSHLCWPTTIWNMFTFSLHAWCFYT